MIYSLPDNPIPRTPEELLAEISTGLCRFEVDTGIKPNVILMSSSMLFRVRKLLNDSTPSDSPQPYLPMHYAPQTIEDCLFTNMYISQLPVIELHPAQVSDIYWCPALLKEVPNFRRK